MTEIEGIYIQSHLRALTKKAAQAHACGDLSYDAMRYIALGSLAISIEDTFSKKLDRGLDRFDRLQRQMLKI